MTQIEIEGKFSHGHSNQELKVNAVILIQIINISPFCELAMRLIIRLHVFPATVIAQKSTDSSNAAGHYVGIFHPSREPPISSIYTSNKDVINREQCSV
jgi:hypothetical protein